MNTNTGAIRELKEEVAFDEVELTEREAEVLSRYVPEHRPALLKHWRAGRLYVRGGQLAEVVPKERAAARRQVREALERYQHTKRRRHLAAESRAKSQPKKHARSKAHRGHGTKR